MPNSKPGAGFSKPLRDRLPVRNSLKERRADAIAPQAVGPNLLERALPISNLSLEPGEATQRFKRSMTNKSRSLCRRGAGSSQAHKAAFYR